MSARPPLSGMSVSVLLETSSRLFRASLPKCLSLSMLAVLCQRLASYYWRATGHALEPLKPPDDALYDVLTIAGFIGWLWLLSVVMLRQWALTKGAVRAKGEYSAAGRRLPNVFAAAFLGSVALLIGFAPALIASSLLSGVLRTAVVLLLATPNVFLIACFAPLLPIALFERRSPYRAVLHSLALVRPAWAKICAAQVITLLILVVCTLVVAAAIAMLQGLVGTGAVSEALANALLLAVDAIVLVFCSALCLVVYSIASNSA
jgi:hypothetical protein